MARFSKKPKASMTVLLDWQTAQTVRDLASKQGQSLSIVSEGLLKKALKRDAL